MNRAARLGAVVLLTVAVGIGASANSTVGQARPHGCSEEWVNARGPAGFAPSSPRLFKRPTEVVDSFDGPAGAPPNSDTWTVIEGEGWDRGIQNYTADNAVLDGQGHLMLRAMKTDTGYTSGRIETRRKSSFGYGTLIARIKMPAGAGLWPAFWMLGADEDMIPWPEAGEIDVVEMVSDPWKAYSSLHGPIPGVSDYLQSQIVTEGTDLSADFHDYWVIREENKITVGIDQTVWGVFTPETLPPDAQWVYNKPFCLIMNLAVGGDWAGPPDESTEFPAVMLVDWVHWEPD